MLAVFRILDKLHILVIPGEARLGRRPTGVVSHQFKAVNKISVFSVNNGKKYFIWVF